MSQTTFGSGVIFHTRLVSPSSDYQSSNPLPYPPVELWCAQLHPAGASAPLVLFIAQHEDLYNADWIVHQSSASSLAALNSDLEQLGCDLALTP